MFIDEIKVQARAGHGGRGCVAFLREAFRPKGGPSGGNGGRGGDVLLEASHDLNNLVAQYYQPRLIAPNGGHGMGKGKDGRSGKDLIVPVPCGTIVWRLPADPKPLDSSSESAPESPPDSPALPVAYHRRPQLRHAGNEAAVEIDPDSDAPRKRQPPSNPVAGRVWVADLTEHGQQFVLCRGGRGGLGNRNFATATRQTPRFAQPGEPGDEGKFVLELRLLADVGLVGYPNAGKSTLLTAMSQARPKIAPYPFTTLHPQVGIVGYEDYWRLTVCDVPGLIEGAHLDVGLGHAFLRHIQRCRVLVILLDMAGTDGREPWDDYTHLLRELECHDPELLTRPRLVVANKMDQAVAASNLRKFRRRIPGTSVTSIEALGGRGLDRLKGLLRQAVEEADPDRAAKFI